MIKLRDLIAENTEETQTLPIASNSHETVTIEGTSVFLTNLRRDVVNFEVKVVNGVVFVTVK